MRAGGKPAAVAPTQVTQEFFEAVGLRMVQGRSLGSDDVDRAVVNEAFKRQHWPDVPGVVGLDLTLGPRPMQAVGLVRDSLDRALDAAAVPTVYTLMRNPSASMRVTYALRSGGKATPPEHAVEQIITRVNRDAIVTEVGPPIVRASVSTAIAVNPGCRTRSRKASATSWPCLGHEASSRFSFRPRRVPSASRRGSHGRGSGSSSRSSREGVQDGYAGRRVVGHVAGDHGEAVHQRRRGDLLVQWIFRVWDPQLPPYLRDLLIEWENRVCVIACDRAEPTGKASCLREVAPMAYCFNALAQLADRDGREEQRDALRRSLPKEPTDTGVGASALSHVAYDVRVDEVHRPSSRPPVDLAALEVGVFTGVRHRRKYLSQRAAPGAQQRLLEDFPMLLFGAVIARGGALFERPHDSFVDVTNHELSHVPITSRC